MEYGLDLEYSFNEFLKGFGLSSEIAHIIWLPLPMLLVLVAAVVGVLVTVWLERKISAAAQQRIGPEYAGALGVLQPIADGLKLLVKEDIIPAKADGILFTAGPILVLVPVILSWLIVPFGQNLLISNVGKSSLLAALTRAKPKIANYPFTTINPNLGVTSYDGKELTLADIPGLVEGAHKGVGLGDKFLRHIERCKVLLHLIDLTEKDLLRTYKKIKMELCSYDKKLSSKKEIILFNKADLLDKQEIKEKLKNFKTKTESKCDYISVYSKKDIEKIKKILIKHAN